MYDCWKQQYALYNLVTDPVETNDMAASQPTLVKDFAQRSRPGERCRLTIIQRLRSKPARTRRF
jgi:hypothetical protein